MPTVTLLESMPDFKRAIAQNKLSVVDFFAVWCGPCKAISPRYEKIASETPSASFYKVNVDNLPDVAREYGVTAMPTFKLFKSGKLIDTVVGANVAGLEAKIKQHATPAVFSGVGRTLGGGSPASSPTSPTAGSTPSPSSSSASSSTSAFAAFKSPAADTLSGAAAPAAAAHQQTNSTFVWIAVVFLLVYWYLGQRNAAKKDGFADSGYEF